jgi:hypothetical protein
METVEKIRSISYQAPTAVELLTPAEAALRDVEAFMVDCLPMRDIATQEMNAAKTKAKQLDEREKQITRPILAGLDEIRDLFRGPKELMKKVADLYAVKIIDFNREQDRRRRIEEEKLAESARKEQAKVREEAARVAAKAAADAEVLRQKAADAAAAGNAGQAARLALRAEATVEAGENKAAALNDMADAAPIAPVLAAAPKMDGAHETGRWSAEVTDKAALVAFVAANPMFLHLLDVNAMALNAQARSLKDAFQIPGCRAIKKVGLTSRAA